MLWSRSVFIRRVFNVMSNSGNPIWMYLFGGLIVAIVAMFFVMGGSVDDVAGFISSPGPMLNDFGSASFENPTKGVFDGVSAVGDSIGGALGGVGR